MCLAPLPGAVTPLWQDAQPLTTPAWVNRRAVSAAVEGPAAFGPIGLAKFVARFVGATTLGALAAGGATFVVGAEVVAGATGDALLVASPFHSCDALLVAGATVAAGAAIAGALLGVGAAAAIGAMVAGVVVVGTAAVGATVVGAVVTVATAKGALAGA